MAFILLFLAASALFIQNGPYHLFVMVVHGVVVLWMTTRLLGKQPLAALLAGIYVAFYIPNPVAIHAGWVELEAGTTLRTLYLSNVLIVGGLDIFLICVKYFRPRKLTDLDQMPPIRVDSYLATCAIVSLLGIAGTAIAVLLIMGRISGVNVLLVEKSFRTTLTGPLSVVYLVTNYLAMIVPLATFLVALRRFGQQLLFLVPILLILVVYFMIFRVRTPPIAIMMAYGLGLALRRRTVTLGYDTVARKLPVYLKTLMLIGLLSFVPIALSVKYLRWSYEVQDLRIDEQRLQVLLDQVFMGGDLGYAVFVRFAMETYPSQYPYLNGQSYYRILFMPIPRTLWPAKPVSTERIFGAQVDPDGAARGLTVTPGLVGDLYINFGYLGPLGMAGWGLLFSRERYRGLTALLFLSGSGFWMLHFGRGSIASPLAAAVFIFGVSYLLNRLLHPVVIGPAPQQAHPYHAPPQPQADYA